MPEPWTVHACKHCGGILDEVGDTYQHRYGTDGDACVSKDTWLVREDVEELQVVAIATAELEEMRAWASIGRTGACVHSKLRREECAACKLRFAEAELAETSATARRLHKALSEGNGVEDGGVWEDRALAAEAEVERLRKRSHEIATAKDREMAGLQSQVDRYRWAFAEAREAVKSFRADWTTDPPSQEEGGFWRYASTATCEAMAAVMLAANEHEMKYRRRAQDAEYRSFSADRAYRALAREAADLLGERAPGAAAMFDQAAEEGLMDMVVPSFDEIETSLGDLPKLLDQEELDTPEARWWLRRFREIHAELEGEK